MQTKIRKITKSSQEHQAYYKAVMVYAKKHKDPLYKKYLKYSSKLREFRLKLMKKYLSRVKPEVKKKIK